MHQTAWFRLLVPVLGAGVVPAAAVSAGALLGLAIGSLLGGRLADRGGRPGWVFIGAEAAAALMCALLPFGVALLDGLADAMALPPGSEVGGSLQDLVLLLFYWNE